MCNVRVCCNFLGSSPPKNRWLEYDPVGFQPVAKLLVSGRYFFAFHVAFHSVKLHVA